MNQLIALLLLAVTTALADVTKGEFGAGTSQSAASDPKREAATEGPKQTKRNSYPFHGTLASVDSSGKSLSLAGKQKARVILITSETHFFRNGVKVKLDDAIAGERVNRNDFGAGVGQLTFMPNSDALAAATQFLVHGSLARWLDRVIDVKRVEVVAQENALRIGVVYVKRSTGEERDESFLAPWKV